MTKKYFFKETDITIDIIFLIEKVVTIISEKEKKSFDECYEKFLKSKTYAGLTNPSTMLWTESAEYIVDDFYREQRRDLQ
ncbi:MAG: hypothetical protein ACRCUS_05600 [Anaerovoracaceae bacterium]